jgi:hypothetical protein
MAVDELSEKFEHLKQWTEISVRKATSDTLATVHKATRAAFGTRDQQPQLFLMIGARLDDWKAILMTTSATAVATVNEFDSLEQGRKWLDY